ncbi:MAG: acetoacetate decarboxylase family protein [Leptolyngbyaceae cyanobacterium bins.349]|nr:acetoacetate decarboxylase family protein [Leptolyngbyaceae cyanobacterium bins.349]
MTYPPPPWTIQGFGLLNVHLLDVDRVRSVIPAELQIIPVFPGKTVGGVFVASYGLDSVMPYNELIVVSGLVAYKGKVGPWISHIYVDHPDSVAGGRDIWGLPKELAEFEWTLTGQPQVQVRQDDRPLCHLTAHWRSPSLPTPPIAAPVISKLRTDPVVFTASGSLNLQLAGVTLDVPPASPFASLELGQGWLSFYSDRLSVVVAAPSKIH